MLFEHGDRVELDGRTGTVIHLPITLPYGYCVVLFDDYPISYNYKERTGYLGEMAIAMLVCLIERPAVLPKLPY